MDDAPRQQFLPPPLYGKHHVRKHGKNAYYKQAKDKNKK
jgi:hypothetical protein